MRLYVGLSRVRSLDGLYLKRALTERDIVMNPRVPEWMESAA